MANKVRSNNHVWSFVVYGASLGFQVLTKARPNSKRRLTLQTPIYRFECLDCLWKRGKEVQHRRCLDYRGGVEISPKILSPKMRTFNNYLISPKMRSLNNYLISPKNISPRTPFQELFTLGEIYISYLFKFLNVPFFIYALNSNQKIHFSTKKIKKEKTKQKKSPTKFHQKIAHF